MRAAGDIAASRVLFDATAENARSQTLENAGGSREKKRDIKRFMEDPFVHGFLGYRQSQAPVLADFWNGPSARFLGGPQSGRVAETLRENRGAAEQIPCHRPQKRWETAQTTTPLDKPRKTLDPSVNCLCPQHKQHQGPKRQPNQQACTPSYGSREFPLAGWWFEIEKEKATSSVFSSNVKRKETADYA